jgi:hypothetical protein
MEDKYKAKIKKVEDSFNKILEEEELDLVYTLDFPKYRELPIEVELALKVLENHGGVIIKKYTLQEKTKEDLSKKLIPR